MVNNSILLFIRGVTRGLGERITAPMSCDEFAETFAPSPAPWSQTNTQWLPLQRPSIRLSLDQGRAWRFKEMYE